MVVVISAMGSKRALRFSTIGVKGEMEEALTRKIGLFDDCPTFYAARRQNNAVRVNETLFRSAISAVAETGNRSMRGCGAGHAGESAGASQEGVTILTSSQLREKRVAKPDDFTPDGDAVWLLFYRHPEAHRLLISYVKAVVTRFTPLTRLAMFAAALPSRSVTVPSRNIPRHSGGDSHLTIFYPDQAGQ